MIRHPQKAIGEMSEAEWERAFPDEETCIEWLVAARWPDEMRCPRCGSDLVFPASLHEYRWRCFGCVPDLGHSFDYLSGTIFQPAPLRAWFKAMHDELTGKGPSFDADELAMRRRIRDAVPDSDFHRIVGARGPVPSSRPQTAPAKTRSDAKEKPCPAPQSPAILLR